ncbi:MAG: hypothetical protein COW24_00070 [Candidatus Kerfeldbacteria bacterium CG15_BIG_FIL_POST_REV_8_21_14_020_45_12]|uniref:RNA polymerase sigma-70 region 4 domain-containing protein n=1 Tax=Candidatus Kerfeldbacteria bacterium CG15_BIG_FIL_POST_REV_8_21_14_020_45_12 TaxID=2014247 RepID=A0A2M7H5E7_9BACT|nr:MAG: hypothetical protein COW24_00070 [Candidatus Kerfeldbacteria bacterium CG15_BIG_FIL_POST_REV_8_21_14_020_45_12]PJA93642.1 MAG: hypothetical protein CO132_02110 [Candidatus Kerfeldbacteria bacterium CG_4_9_14_3_um_filter_45_8]
MPDSILDKVLSSKEDQEKQEFSPLDVVNQLLKAVSSKEADVVRRRFGLTDRGKETLETIGSFYNVTRERIRQIENQSIAKVKAHPGFTQTIKPVEHLVSTLLDHHGGVMSEEMAYENLLGVHSDDDHHRQAVNFILSQLLDEKIESLPKAKKYNFGWKLKLASLDFADSAIEALLNVIQEVKQPQSFEQLFERFRETEFYTKNNHKLTEDAVISYLDVSAKVGRNPFGEYGKSSWGLIQPRRMNDRVFLVLQKEGEPMHFEEIAKRITKIFKKKAYPPTVHNELILNKEYVLVGRGIYALKDWGYKEGVVSDVIVDILKAASEPLTRPEIVKRVLEQRIVKKNTIHLALTDKTLFRKNGNGRYECVVQTGPNESSEETAPASAVV